MPKDAIFVLDIGTRTIAGLVGIQQGHSFVIRAAEVLEHEGRAMVDGQIHDRSKVVSGVSRVREQLEEQVGYSLNKVSIAAAAVLKGAGKGGKGSGRRQGDRFPPGRPWRWKPSRCANAN